MDVFGVTAAVQHIVFLHLVSLGVLLLDRLGHVHNQHHSHGYANSDADEVANRTV